MTGMRWGMSITAVSQIRPTVPQENTLPRRCVTPYRESVDVLKVYVERNAMRGWLTDLRRQGKIALVLFPYDGRTPAGVQLATPSVVTADSTWLTADMTIPISDMVESTKLEQIRKIIRRENEKKIMAPAGPIGEETEGDARHLDSAYKSACHAFLTTDKQDILQHAAELESVLGFRLFHPDEDHDRFLAFINAYGE